MNLFIVCGTVGEYSDQITWIVPKAYRDEEMAKALIAELQEEMERISAATDYVYSVDEDGEVECEDYKGDTIKIQSKLRTLDPRFYHQGRNMPTYSMDSVELCDAVDTFLDAHGVRR